MNVRPQQRTRVPSPNIPQHRATQYAQPEKQANRLLHNLVEKSRTLGFQQENQDWKEKSATFIKESQLVLYQISHYSICASEENSEYKISVTTQISNSNVVI